MYNWLHSNILQKTDQHNYCNNERKKFLSLKANSLDIFGCLSPKIYNILNVVFIFYFDSCCFILDIKYKVHNIINTNQIIQSEVTLTIKSYCYELTELAHSSPLASWEAVPPCTTKELNRGQLPNHMQLLKLCIQL